MTPEGAGAATLRLEVSKDHAHFDNALRTQLRKYCSGQRFRMVGV